MTQMDYRSLNLYADVNSMEALPRKLPTVEYRQFGKDVASFLIHPLAVARVPVYIIYKKACVSFLTLSFLDPFGTG